MANSHEPPIWLHSPDRSSLDVSFFEVLLSLAPRAVDVGIGTLIFVAPLAIEGVVPAGAFVVEALLTFTFCAWWMSRSASPNVAPLRSNLWVATVAIVGIVGLFQLIPLPRTFLALISPAQVGIQDHTLPLISWYRAGAFGSYSVSSSDTASELVRFFFLAVLILVVRDRTRGKHFRRQLLQMLLISGLVQLFLGLIHRSGEATSIYFLPGGVPGDERFLGSFVSLNRNAAYLNLLWPVALVLGVEGFLRWHPQRSGFSRWSLRRSAGTGLWSWAAYCCVAGFYIGGVIVCESRMAWVILGGLLLSVALFVLARSGKPRVALTLWGIAIGGSVVGGIRYHDAAIWTMSEWAGKSAELLRPKLWDATWKMAMDHWLLGTGLGTFHDAFGAYSPIHEARSVIKLEGVYLEILAELGFPASVLLILILLLGLIALVKRRFWESSSGRFGSVGLLLGLIGLLVHASVDLIFRGYGTSVTAAIMIGILWSALVEDSTLSYDPVFRYGRPTWRCWLPVPVGGLTILFLGLNGLAGYSVSVAERAPDFGALLSSEVLLKFADATAPWSPKPPLWLGVVSLRRAQVDWGRFEATKHSREGGTAALDSALVHTVEAERYLFRAVALEPLAAHGQRLLSRTAELSGMNLVAVARARDACRVQPTDYRNWAQLGATLLRIGAQDEGMEALRDALSLAPRVHLEWLIHQLLVAANGDLSLVERYVPVSGHAHIPFVMGRMMVEAGDWQRARHWYVKAIEVQYKSVQPLYKIGRDCIKQHDFNFLSQVLAALGDQYPESIASPRLIGAWKTMTGDTDEAVVALERCASLMPPGVRFLVEAVWLLVNDGREDEALVRLKEMRGKFPYDYRVLSSLGRLQWQIGNRHDALRAFRSAIRTRTDFEEPRWFLYQMFRDIGLAADAEDELDDCVQLAISPRCKWAEGVRAIKNHRFEEAVFWLEKSVAENRNFIKAWSALAKARAGAEDAEGSLAADRMVRLLTEKESIKEDKFEDAKKP